VYHRGHPMIPMIRRLGITAALRTALVSCLLLCACRSATGPQPQAATFPSGQRVARSGAVAIELHEAHYDLRHVSVTVSLTNHGQAPVSLDRSGILLAYRELEFPVREGDANPVQASTTLPPGGTVKLELGFGTEQMMVEAGVLQLLSLRAGEDWLAPLRVTIPPPAAFVEAAAEPQEDEEP
jgi:hypothetical protein